MNTDSELVVISAAGSSRLTVVRPVRDPRRCVASIFSFAVDNGVDPYARERGRHLVAEARADLLSLVIQEGTFKKIEDGLFVQIGERLPDGRLGGIFVADSRAEGHRPDLLRQDRRGGAQGRQERPGDEGRRRAPQVAGRRRVGRALHLLHVRPVGLHGLARPATSRCWPRTGRSPICSIPDPNDPIYQYQPQIVPRRVAPALHANGSIRWSSR